MVRVKAEPLKDTRSALVRSEEDVRSDVQAIQMPTNKWKCEFCEFSTSAEGYLAMHIQGTHGNMGMSHQDPERYICMFCEYKGSDLEIFQRHVKDKHEKGKEYACEYCDLRVENKRKLDVHVKTFHQEIKKFACQFCNFKTLDKTSLKNHVKDVHDNVKEFPCGQCNFKSTVKPTLDKHFKEVHSTNKDYTCDQCDYRATYLYDVRQHIKAFHIKIEKGTEVKVKKKRCVQRSSGTYDDPKGDRRSPTGRKRQGKG